MRSDTSSDTSTLLRLISPVGESDGRFVHVLDYYIHDSVLNLLLLLSPSFRWDFSYFGAVYDCNPLTLLYCCMLTWCKGYKRWRHRSEATIQYFKDLNYPCGRDCCWSVGQRHILSPWIWVISSSSLQFEGKVGGRVWSESNAFLWRSKSYVSEMQTPFNGSVFSIGGSRFI